MGATPGWRACMSVSRSYALAAPPRRISSESTSVRKGVSWLPCAAQRAGVVQPARAFQALHGLRDDGLGQRGVSRGIHARGA